MDYDDLWETAAKTIDQLLSQFDFDEPHDDLLADKMLLTRVDAQARKDPELRASARALLVLVPPAMAYYDFMYKPSQPMSVRKYYKTRAKLFEQLSDSLDVIGRLN